MRKNSGKISENSDISDIFPLWAIIKNTLIEYLKTLKCHKILVRRDTKHLVLFHSIILWKIPVTYFLDFQAYNIHINGLFHCAVRYKQLLNLHEQLVNGLNVPLPPFPPKKFFPLTVNQQEERRLALERYIQTIGQNTSINNSELLNGFLRNAQQETGGRVTENENFEVLLMNGQNVIVKVSTGDSSNIVLKVIIITLAKNPLSKDFQLKRLGAVDFVLTILTKDTKFTL